MTIRLFDHRRARQVGWLVALLGAAVGCAKVEQKEMPDAGKVGGGRDASAADVPSPGSGPDATGPGSIPDATGDRAPQACRNLQCQQVTCPNGGTTSVSGTTFAPNGTLPLYNVMVYVPNEPLAPFKEGVSCDRCGAGATRTVASAISNEHGAFRITNVPVGKNIPLVFQVGKWRRQVTIPTVAACQDHPIADPNLTRLPRNRGEGDLPKMAVTTGSCDDLGCLFVRVGLDPTELGIAGENKAVTFYGDPVLAGSDVERRRGPASPTSVSRLWGDEAELSKYDVITMSCQCQEALGDKGPAAFNAMTKYLAKGGRIFNSHFMYSWYRDSTDPNLARTLTIRRDQPGPNTMGPVAIDTSFPKGKALADWMTFLDPTVPYGEFTVNGRMEDITSFMAATTQVWATSLGKVSNTPGPRIVTINTPVGVPADQQCGRAAYLDIHVTVPRNDTTEVFPGICGDRLVKSEQALAFLFFDLAACIQEDSKPIVPPIIVP